MTRKYEVKIKTNCGNSYIFPWDVEHTYVYKAKHIAELFMEFAYVEVMGKGKMTKIIPMHAISEMEFNEVTDKGQPG